MLTMLSRSHCHARQFCANLLAMPKPHGADDLVHRLQLLNDSMVAFDEPLRRYPNLHPKHATSARNLLQYLWMRQFDIGDLQIRLHNAGLSALSSSETHIRHQLQQVIRRLHTEAGEPNAQPNAEEGDRLLVQHAHALFGLKAREHLPALMVTIDSKWLEDGERTMEQLLRHGMRIARINCAHDDAATWENMIRELQRATQSTGHRCSLYMDLSGPKFRLRFMGKYKSEEKIDLMMHQRLYLCEKGIAPDDKAVAISCEEPGITAYLKRGTEVWMDDGKFQAVVTKVEDGYAVLRITRITGKPMLKPKKGLAFLGVDIPVPSLTEQDIRDLEFIREHADMVGYSYVRTAAEVQQLQALLKVPGAKKDPAIIIKIETPESVQNLPHMLLQLMEGERFGVMIARGDLAVEIGFERLGEIQEEISWICEAAHTPVIWATQVLDSLNKTGLASRSEITDAYKAAQSECIMINKGKHTDKVLETLKDLVRRSKRHHAKKRYRLDDLDIAHRFFT